MGEWDLEEHIREWRTALAASAPIGGDAEELESHLRDRIDELEGAGLSPDEAFLIAVKRMGPVDDLTDEFAREHSDRLWKQLMPAADAPRTRSARLWTVVAFAALAALLVKLPQLFPSRSDLEVGSFGLDAVVNGVILVLAVLGAMFIVRARPRRGAVIGVAVAFVLVTVAVNVMPFDPEGMTWALAAIHAPIALWLCVGVLYAGGDWRSGRARMDFIRFTGEWFVYFVLIALGGGVLVALTLGLFSAVGIDASPFVAQWMLPCGAAAAVIVAAWLVEQKQSVIENIAPVLTKAFSPLFTVLLLALIVLGIIQGNLVGADRDLLILFDVTLIVVLGLLLYGMSSRDPIAPAGWFDRLQLLLLTSALVVDAIVLIAMLSRIGAFGVTANKAASLGLNLILFVNLAWAAWLQLRFAMRRTPFARLERWQTGYVPVYLAWAAIVVLVFPPLFGYA